MIDINSKARLFGAIEAGGTKFICVIANEVGEILLRKVIATEQPEQTLHNCVTFFVDAELQLGKISALGIGSFGPVELSREADDYGCIKKTPKAGWSGTNIVGFFAEKLGVPVAFETDVNAAAIGEYASGAAKACSNFVYVTIGTGVGAGVMINGRLLQGVSHPEIGHMLMPRYELDAHYKGCCPFHGACLEGLISGVALNDRAVGDPKLIAADHKLWDIAAYYMAVMCVNLTLFFSPEKIILSGGVMQQMHLFPKIRLNFIELINNYAHDRVLKNINDYIVPTGLEGKAGIIGSLKLAMDLT